MRTDVTLSKKKVICPHASLLGYGTRRAKPGMFVRWDGGHGRIIATIDYAPPLGETPEIKGWLLVMTLSDDLSFAYERWIDPKDVIECRPWPTKFFLWMAQPTLPYDPYTIRRLMEYGTLNDEYIDNISTRVEEWGKEN